ncbi:MAG TPA: hypothetical protein VFS20_18225 [Longimicrobium sp.]|nr:hypothetical protein [Longimicrobium sp.]
MAAMITVSGVTSPESAAPFVRLIAENSTYLNLQAHVCPAGGGFNVTVQSNDPDATEPDVTGMVMSVMFSAIRRAG